MPETIETFVAKLQTEGVQAGKAEADKIVADAQAKAEQVLADAKAQADKIVADAETQAQGLVSRGKTELELAARDATLKLQDTLSRALQAVLRQGAQATLADVDFLGKVLHELILMYAKDEQTARQGFKVNVPQELRQDLVDWALQEIGKEKIENIHMPIDLKSTLKTAGFEYTTSGGTVEVTLDSVVEVLSDLVSPSLRKLIEPAPKSQE